MTLRVNSWQGERSVSQRQKAWRERTSLLSEYCIMHPFTFRRGRSLFVEQKLPLISRRLVSWSTCVVHSVRATVIALLRRFDILIWFQMCQVSKDAKWVVLYISVSTRFTSGVGRSYRSPSRRYEGQRAYTFASLEGLYYEYMHVSERCAGADVRATTLFFICIELWVTVMNFPPHKRRWPSSASFQVCVKIRCIKQMRYWSSVSTVMRSRLLSLGLHRSTWDSLMSKGGLEQSG